MTFAGTLATELSLTKLIRVPPDGAAALSLMVAVVVPPPPREFWLSVKLESGGLV